MDIILKYFPHLEPVQVSRFSTIKILYTKWNEKINVISRKDIGHLYERHILHSLSIAKLINFAPGTRILDAGTGGGFPGIPLAILFPGSQFHLVDSIGKKIKVVAAIAETLGLHNVTCEQARAESLHSRFDFVVSRAVTTLPQFERWVNHLISEDHKNDLLNGILYLKGGILNHELDELTGKYTVYPISSFFEEEFFKTKVLVHIT
ncbi:MAG: 16S rRNA (guanine(527)-N(7))-methyltransferase RsmG [Bacteroidales bacterium]